VVIGRVNRLAFAGSAGDYFPDMEKQLTRVSKRMSYVLRHSPQTVNLTLDSHGWVDLGEFLRAMEIDRATLDAVVAGNDKHRFAVEIGPDGRERIRASQGHSITVDLALDPVSPPPNLFHGTSVRAMPSILAQGLLKQGRHHVHLSADSTTARIVGERRRSEIAILRVDAAGMAADGHVFFRSANGVWLTDHVPPAYIERC
jgi:putative RNA 2'-phosphotransferase